MNFFEGSPQPRQHRAERVGEPDYVERHYQNTMLVTITQRDRGVYLCNGSEDQHGTEEWEATSTLAKAKQWGAEYLDVKRPKWRRISTEEQWPAFMAERTFNGDAYYVDPADA